ncbi:AAA family ATPase [Collimonas silvisoli]|uniref:AAA family ATPase n=1 Tax=Collimonas silvisoli TaxID=2825884 RepID=UPI001B8D1BCF|nr:AAA family ATPase [Collimonas silvisoli]
MIDTINGFKAMPEEPDAKAARDMIEKAFVSHRTVNLRCGADIKPQAITWLWSGWLPAGKLTILAGTAGTGKTTLALSLAATLTVGGRWPDGAACVKPGNVLIWSSEDNPDDTLAPRLIASGADMRRCHFIDGITENGEKLPFDPAQDIHELNKAVLLIGGVSLLIVDPIVSAVSGDMHRANDVRRSLQVLVDFAEAHGCAVLGITHFAKGGAGKSPQDRVIGSQAFGALARMVLVAAKEENGSRRVLARAKSNIAPDDGGVSYNLEVTEITGGIVATRVLWEGAIEGTAREILGDVEHGDSEGGNERQDAEQFLTDLLADGPLPTKQIKADAHGAGYAWRTIERAKRDLGIEANKPGMKEGWQWILPKTAKNTEHRHTNNVAVFPKIGGVRGGLHVVPENEMPPS